jgi:hypothetical protein
MTKELERDLYFVLQTEQGRRYLYDLMDFCGLHRPSMTGNSQTFFNEGMRNVALKLFADIGKADPNAYIKMMSEHKFRAEAQNRKGEG